MSTLPKYLQTSPQCRPSTKLEGAMDAYCPLLATWLIEMTLALGWYKKNPGRRRSTIFEENSFSVITGIYAEIVRDGTDDDMLVTGGKSIKYSDAAAVKILKRYLVTWRKKEVRDELSLLTNIETLGRVLGLCDADKAILFFAISIETFASFKEAICSMRYKVKRKDLAHIIAYLSGQAEAEVSAGLRDDSTLLGSGIVCVDDDMDDMEDKLRLLSGLSGLLVQSDLTEESLAGWFMRKADKSKLGLQGFPHLVQDVHALQCYLGNALKKREPGTNILIHGVPGTGKTEFVKALAGELGVELYEISYDDDEGGPITGNDRLRAYNLCQRLLVRKDNALLMFDEVEDVFPSSGGFQELFGFPEARGSGKSGKAWINRTLECNTTPAIWITNDADIDPAYLRRFDYSIRFPVPPQQVRMAIARHHLGQFDPTEQWLAQIAANEQMSPAQYERAAKVARLGGGDAEHARALVEQTLDRSATLLGQKRTPSRNTLHTGYDLRFANTSMAMPDILGGLKKRRQGSFCFYGPAGTGKSELARHIADELGRPCLVRRASDLLSKWVGGSEKNIAEMFAEARQQEAVLVLDEADSFLADRRDAQRSWEVTQVNELLTQMEAFNGIFVCTTNLMDRLDQASLRRFAFKVKFDYLSPNQRWEMFLQEYQRMGGDESNVGDWQRPVQELAKLTPGDFAVAARQFAILDMPVTAAELHRQLLEECRVKGGATGRIGFVR
ncbi:MAG: ATP-binding protein [Gallionella sp.]|nr:ATP-binding protein [Gallionella sp.]MDD4947378.1 ATP-binding protein [Gallionella sp.]